MSENTITEEEVKKPPTFDQQKNYQWAPDTEFTLKGGELHALNAILKALIAPPEAQRAIAAYEGLKLVDGIIREGVETGKIIEVPQEEPKNMQ